MDRKTAHSPDQLPECPECGSDEVGDNGERPDHEEYTLMCSDCGWQWCPNDS